MTLWHYIAIAIIALVGSWLLLVAVWVAMALFSYIAGAVGL